MNLLGFLIEAVGGIIAMAAVLGCAWLIFEALLRGINSVINDEIRKMKASRRF